jgi:hypothetical protein
MLGRELEVAQDRERGDVGSVGLGLIQVYTVGKPDDISVFKLDSKLHGGSNKGIAAPRCDGPDL